jgi:hypothetical protein
VNKIDKRKNKPWLRPKKSKLFDRDDQKYLSMPADLIYVTHPRAATQQPGRLTQSQTRA